MTKLHTITTCIIAVIMMTTAQAAKAGDYQHKTLFNPSKYQLQAEADGRVMIYDQMDNETVELALDSQFDRIDTMMFVRTQYAQEDGSMEEDDSCSD